MLRGFLFDLDGVLADTEGLYSQFWRAMGAKYAPDVPNLDVVIKGHTLDNIYATHFPDPEVQQAITPQLETFEANMPFRLYDGVIPLLEDIHRRGLPVAVVTSSSRRKINHLLDQHPQLRPLISSIIVDTDVPHGKPHPEPYLRGAEALGLRPEECVVVEDSLSGLQSGRAAGAFTVGIATGNPMQVLTPLSDMVYERLADLDVDKLSEAFERWNNNKLKVEG